MLADAGHFEYSPAQLQRERQDRVSDLLDRLDLDVLVVLSGGARGQRGNVRYVSNYATLSQSSCVLWPRAGVPRLLVPYSVHKLWAAEMSWIRDIQLDANYPRAIAQYLQERHLERARIGWVGPSLLLDGLRAQFDALDLGLDNSSAQDAYSTMRLVKTPEEIKLVRRCGEIADRILERIGEIICPASTERDLVAEAEYLARCAGCEGISVLISRGTLMAQPIPQDVPLQKGDIVQVSVEPEGPGGMWVQTVRMYALGKPSTDWMRLIEAGLESERRGVALLKDGSTCATVAQAMAAMLPGRVPLITPLGHGIGLDNSEPPRIGSDSRDTLAEDMTMVLHPTEYGDTTAVYLGSTYLIHTDVAERLSEIPSDLIIV